MIRKPWPIVIVSFLFFLMPIFNLVVTYAFLEVKITFLEFCYHLVFNPQNRLLFFSLTLPSLITSFSIYKVKKWSYPVFLLCMLWITAYMGLSFTSHFTAGEFILIIIVPMFINIMFVSYLLLPNLRAPYFNDRLRWWETKPRYIYSTQCKMTVGDISKLGEIQNISEGGVFLSFADSLAPQSIVSLQFIILDIPIEINAKVAYRKNDGPFYGLQFYEMTKNQKLLLKKIIHKLVENKTQETRAIPLWSEDLKKWITTLLKTGKGLLPDQVDQKK